MNREEQLAAFRADANGAYLNLLAFIGTHEQEIREAAYARLDAGYDLYGTDGWRKSPAELTGDAIEECADAVVYLAMRRRRLAA